MEDVGNGEGYACVRAKDMWEFFVPSTQFGYETKTILKKKKKKRLYNNN